MRIINGLPVLIIILSVLISGSFVGISNFSNYNSSTFFLFTIGFCAGFSASLLFDIYFISVMIAKMKKKEISFINAKLIIAVSASPLVLLFFLRHFFLIQN